MAAVPPAPSALQRSLSIRLNLDDGDAPSDVAGVLFPGRFAAGERPHAHSTGLDPGQGRGDPAPGGPRCRGPRRTTTAAPCSPRGGWSPPVSRWNRGRGRHRDGHGRGAGGAGPRRGHGRACRAGARRRRSCSRCVAARPRRTFPNPGRRGRARTCGASGRPGPAGPGQPGRS
ncbi:DUF5925 domain-containing protein [Streptomyces sp. NPDC001744]|uniref:DUF5925 domain-containing protein n=1 Tax=Streptomyces sp. NPDC001744 TaxID=3364606 RepID=UPI0036749B17